MESTSAATPALESLRSRLRKALVQPIDPAALAVFRFGFGSIVAWEVWRAFDGNLIRADYDLPTYLFRWWLFEWVRPLPGSLIYVAFGILGVAAVFLALGFFYRIAAAVTYLGLTYWLLLDKASYLNHRYLAGLFALLLFFVRADASYSLDNIRKKRRLPQHFAPSWSLWLIRFQVGAPYFFSGISKLNFDWLFRAEPLKLALAQQTDFPVVGRFFESNALAHVLAWGSAMLDCTVPFLLLHRRTRVPAFALAIGFHFMNSRLFGIGIFPWMMIVGTSVFFDPDWPRRLLASLRSPDNRLVRPVVAIGAAMGFAIGGFLPREFAIVQALSGAFGVGVLTFHVLPERLRQSKLVRREEVSAPGRFVLGRATAVLLVAWVAVQVLLPLRHFVIPGNVHWTEEGNRFAWHLLLRVKTARLAFILEDNSTDERWVEDLSRHLTPYQISKARLPDMILQLAHHLKGHYAAQGRDVEVRVQAVARLNGRPEQSFIFPNQDLTEVSRPYIPPADWIEPLEPYNNNNNNN
jgi:vitamin K-dependent gamma-carboxylase